MSRPAGPTEGDSGSGGDTAPGPDSAGTPGGAASPVVVARAELYSSLVTRQTGRAVRLSIEEKITGRRSPVVTVLDFREVSVIDFSCADEVAAKLAGSAVASGDRGEKDLFLLFTGMEPHHLDPVDSALQRRGLAVAAERADGTPLVLGDLDDHRRRAWEYLCRAGGARVPEIARALQVDPEAAARLLRALHRRRLALRRPGEFVSLRRAVARARGEGDAP